MVALGLGVLLLIVLGAVLRSALALGAAYALTSLVALPSAADVLVWLAAGGFVVLQFIGCFVALAALLTASKAQRKVGPRPAPPRRR